ncbi:DUF5960 family protein [Vagococcus entomophilus]|uniref:Uncharacterized protein n=1 Tax=Vagococcus entomophilus TaxID=1160095 RepID=A0A430AJZ7_9ENTE|nr:hypothetical protein CBF30_04055 [Vagococcus entomophilus]
MKSKSVDIAFHCAETEAFEKHYYELVSFPIPLLFHQESIVKTMQNTQKDYFIVPRKYSVTGKDLIFHFRKEIQDDCTLYYYRGVSSNKKIIRKFKES